MVMLGKEGAKAEVVGMGYLRLRRKNNLTLILKPAVAKVPILSRRTPETPIEAPQGLELCYRKANIIGSNNLAESGFTL